MIDEHSAVKFRHWGLIMVNLGYMFWLSDYPSRFEGILKKAGLYEAIWPSQFSQPVYKVVVEGPYRKVRS